MQAFLSRLRSQKAEQSSIPFSQTPSSTSSQTPATQTTATPSSQFDGIRKIHPNQDELLSSSPDVSRGSFTELGMRVPSALARVANRKVTPTGIDETIRESSELQRPEESSKLPSESGSPRKQNSSLFSAIPFSGATGWSTFGRNQKENQIPQAPQEERSANARSGGATVSRTSSQSRTTTATRTPPTKSSGLSRSNSAKLSRNNSTKLPTSPSSTTEQASYSRVPLVPTHDIHENVSPRIEEGETSPSHSQQQDETTPSSPSARPLSVFTSATPHEHTIDGTYPPRTTVTKNPEPIASSSLPFTFGRQPPARPLAENVFISELGVPTTDLSEAEANQTEIRRSSAILASKAAVPGGNQWPSMVAEEILRLSFLPHGSGPSTQTDEPFPLLGTPSSELVPSGTNAHPRTHLASDTSTDPYGSTSDDNITGVPHRIPSLISDYSNAEQSQGAGRGWTPDLPLRGMASFGSSGDELTTPRIASSWTNPSEISSRFDAGTRVRQTSDERRRIRSGSSSSTGIRLFHRQTSSDKSMGILKAKNPNLPAIGPVEPITVFPVATTSSQEFPKQDNSEPAITTAGSHNPDASTSTSETATNPPVAPVVAVTAPTPPRPSRSRSRSNRLTELFTRESLRIPEGHAHASGIGVVGVEPHSRRQSLKVMGKRKAGESEEENEIVVNDERGHRPRFDSSAPSSYHRKRMKLSSNASEKDAAAVRASRAASHSGAPSTRSFESSSRPATAAGGHRRNMSRNGSAVSVPISAIISPRAPSIRRSISGASRRSDGFRYQDPLRNRNSRNQRRRRRENFADSWILDRDEMPVQAWLFIIGFIFPLCWWAALFVPVRRGGKGKGPATDQETGADKSGSGLWVDQAQYDEELARLWRGRCLVAAIVSTLFYVPIIVCAVVFSKR